MTEVPIAQVELREVVAQLVYPDAFEKYSAHHSQFYRHMTLENAQKEALEIAGRILAALATTQAGAVGGVVTVADYNAVFDPADDAGRDAYTEGFREGWIFAQTPDGSDYDEHRENYGHSIDMEPQEAWGSYRDEWFKHLPLAALPTIGEATTQAPASYAEGIEAAARVAEEYPSPMNDLPMALAMRSVAIAIRALASSPATEGGK